MVATIALPVTLWRSMIAHHRGVTAQSDLLNGRYQKGVEMLGNEELPVRLGGIYALRYLAEQHPYEYHVQIMSLLSAFVRLPPRGQGAQWEQPETRLDSVVRHDVETIIELISARSKSQRVLEQKALGRLDLSGAHLRTITALGWNLTWLDLRRANLDNARLLKTNLSHSILSSATLRGAMLRHASLQKAILSDADLSRADLLRAEMTECHLDGGDLSDTHLWGANLSRAILDGSRLIGADLRRADLSFTSLLETDFSGAMLQDANLSGANLSGSRVLKAEPSDAEQVAEELEDLSTEEMSKRFDSYEYRPAIGLTQAQLDQAWAESNHPPKLDGVTDIETGSPLVWRGKQVFERT